MKQYTNSGNKDTRSGFGAGLLEAGQKNPEIVALTADLAGSLKMDAFAEAFPERFIQCGIAEANMIGVAAGLAISGKIPFAGSFAEFVNPCDYNQAKAATIAAAEYEGPVYLRFGRPGVPNFTPADQKFEIGKAVMLNEGTDVTLFATGHLVWEALQACQLLENEGISAEVIDIATIKPLDEEAVVASVRKTGAAVCAEEHNITGGLGELVSGTLARRHPAPVEFVHLQN